MNYFADQRYSDIYCSEADLAERFGVPTRNLRGMIKDGRLPEGDIIIQDSGVRQHCYTEESADTIVSTCSNISSSVKKETKMTSTKAVNMNSQPQGIRLNSEDAAKVVTHLMTKFSTYNDPGMSWSEVAEEVIRKTGVKVTSNSVYDRMRTAAKAKKVKLKAKRPKNAKAQPSPKMNAGTLVMEDGTTFKVTMISKTSKTNA